MPCSRSRLTALFLHAAAGAALLGGPATAQSSPAGGTSETAAERSPFLGEWELDLSRMPESYGPPPKRVTFAFRDVGAGQWLTEVDITAPDGSVRHAAARARRDGRAVPIEGDRSEGDKGAFNSPAPNILVVNLAKDRGPQSVRVYAISADGQEMTEAAAGLNGEGEPFVRNFHFRRVR
jgi:hypothetical protein